MSKLNTAMGETVLNGDLAYQAEIQQGVSRTFALTIPQLPAPLRDAVGNACLLCRIADTIEDEAALSAGQKREFSKRWVGVVEGSEDPRAFSDELIVLLTRSATGAERDLVANVPSVMRIANSFSAAQRHAMLRCVRIMTHGMAVLTLRRTYATPACGSGQEVKISRRAVKTAVVATSALARSNAALKRLFTGLGRGLPRVGEAGGPAA